MMTLLRFVPGILIVQAATAVLIMAGTASTTEAQWLPIGGLAVLILLLVAFWFASIADHIKKDALARARDTFARERENLLVAAEADKRIVLEQSHKQIIQETNRAHARANFKLGVAFVGMLGIGAALLFIEFVTIGMLTFAAAGGALAGYLVRARQDAVDYDKRMAAATLPRPSTSKLIEGEVAQSVPRDARKNRSKGA